MKILVVEDDESTRQQLRKWLESDGYEVVEATCGSEALAIITRQDPPELIVIDWMMPAPDGIEVCRRLRQNERDGDRYTYVLMLTARTQPEDMYEGFEVGVDDLMIKPFDEKEMLFRLRSGKRIVKEIVARRKAQTALKEVKKAEKHVIIGLLESIATALSRVENIDELGTMVESTVERMLDVSFTGIYLFDTQSGRLRLLFAKGFTEEERAEAERTAMDRHPGEVFRTQKVLHIPDTDIEPNKSTSSDRSFAIRSRLYLPIMSRETCVGCFGLGSSVPHAFSDEHIQLLRFVGNMATVVYQNILAREAIAVQKQRLAGILRGTNSGTWEWNVQTGETVFNERWAEIIGYSLEELSPVYIETWTSLCHPDDLKASGQLLERHFQGELDYYEFESRMKHKSGAWIWILDRGRVVSWTDNGKPLLMMGTHQDITERKQAEEALKESENRYRLLADNASDVICTMDINLRLTYVSPSIMKLRGYTPKESMEMELQEHMPPKALSIVQKILSEELEKESAPGVDKDRSRVIELEQYVKGGGRVWTEVSTSFLRDKDGSPTGIIGIIRDVTERKQAEKEKAKLESQLRQAQKMEAVGRLAGGVAHDFNNILTGINGYAEMILEGLEPGDPMRADMEEIKSAGKRAAGLTNQLLAFSRKQVISPKVVSPNEILENSQKMLRRIIGEDIDFVFVPAKRLGRIKADPAQLDQILVNLAVNARDAMPDGGKLTIETQNVTLDQEFCDSHVGAEPGDYVMLAVADNGHGMDEETLSNIFEPFFSTKEKDKGTGLGLATVYGITKQNNGFITVYSEPSNGTTFKVYFPRVQDKAEKLTKDKGSDLPIGTETILLVEDEQMVRGLAKKILERQGYKVITMENGGTAYAYYENHDDPFDLLLTDVVMPSMNGRDLYNKLREKRPELKAVFMSGYTENVIAHHGVLDEGISFIQKPFTIKTLAMMVRKVLDS